MIIKFNLKIILLLLLVQTNFNYLLEVEQRPLPTDKSKNVLFLLCVEMKVYTAKAPVKMR